VVALALGSVAATAFAAILAEGPKLPGPPLRSLRHLYPRTPATERVSRIFAAQVLGFRSSHALSGGTTGSCRICAIRSLWYRQASSTPSRTTIYRIRCTTEPSAQLYDPCSFHNTSPGRTEAFRFGCWVSLHLLFLCSTGLNDLLSHGPCGMYNQF